MDAKDAHVLIDRNNLSRVWKAAQLWIKAEMGYKGEINGKAWSDQASRCWRALCMAKFDSERIMESPDPAYFSKEMKVAFVPWYIMAEDEKAGEALLAQMAKEKYDAENPKSVQPLVIGVESDETEEQKLERLKQLFEDAGKDPTGAVVATTTEETKKEPEKTEPTPEEIEAKRLEQEALNKAKAEADKKAVEDAKASEKKAETQEAAQFEQLGPVRNPADRDAEPGYDPDPNASNGDE